MHDDAGSKSFYGGGHESPLMKAPLTYQKVAARIAKVQAAARPAAKVLSTKQH